MILLLGVALAPAGEVAVINFENLPDSTILTTQYTAAYGITFTNTAIINTQILSTQISLNEYEFPPHSGANVATDNGGPMTITFATPVASVGGYFTYGEGGIQNFTHLIIQAFDSHNNLVATTTSAFANNEALSGDPGSTPNTFLQVAAAAGISSIVITGDLNGNSFALDDLTITPLTVIPTITSLVPGTGAQGQQNVTVNISGQGTHWAQGTTSASFGAGVTVKSLSVTSATAATAVISIDPAAVAGQRTVTLTTGTEIASLTNGFTVTPSADLTIISSHSGSFIRGQNGAVYTLTASNTGIAPTSGQVTVTDTLPAGLTATSIIGSGWTCPTGSLVSPLICTRSDALAAGASYPSLTLTVSVAGSAAASLTNTVAVEGGGQLNTANDSATDVTTTILGVCAVPPSGLVSWWGGDGNTGDLYGANNPTASAAVSYVPAEVGNGFLFGTGGNIVISASTGMAGPQFTWSAWVRPDGAGPNNDQFGSVIVQNTFDSDTGISLWWRATDNRFQLSFGSPNSDTFASTHAFPSGQFYLVTGTYDGASLKLYVNGVLEGSYAEVRQAANGVVTIGSSAPQFWAQGFPRTWNGVIDEVQAFNRALTPAEIQALYNLGSVGQCKAPSVISSVTPATAQQGSQNVSVTLTGHFTGWTQGATTATFGAGITVASVTVNALTRATAILNIDPAAAAPGPRDITLTTGTETETLAGGFTVAPGTPVLLSAVPGSGTQGQQSLSVALTGQYTNWVQGTTTASFGAGITVTALTVNSPTTAIATLSIDATALTGTRAVTLTTGAETAALPAGFTVRPGVPLLISASPSTGQQGQQNLTVALNGLFTNWIQGTTVATFGAGVTVTALTVNSPTTATATLSIDATASPGKRSITTTTGAAVETLPNGFTLAPGTPTLLSVNPASGRQGQRSLSIAIAGQYTNWVQGTTAADFGAGVTVTALTVTSPTAATAIIDIDAATPIGKRNVTLTTGAEIAGLPNALTITAGTPALISANPNTGQQGQQNLSVALTGQFTSWVQGSTTATFGAGVAVASFTVNSPVTATAVLNIEAAAATGPRAITLTSGGQIDTLPNGFTVAPGTPVFLTATPTTAQQGQQNLSVSLAGQYTTWVQGTTTANFGAGITVNALTVNSPTSATASVNIDASATIGARSIALTTGAKTDTLANGFSVTAGTPALLSVNPSGAPQGLQGLSVTLTGQYTHWAQDSTTAAFGAGTTVTSVTVTSPIRATAIINIDATAALGPRSPIVTTGAEVVSIPDAFGVLPLSSCLPAPTALIHKWSGEGDGADIAWGANGTLSGGVSFAPGKVGQGFNFAGSGVVTVPHHADMNLTTVTLEGWILLNSSPSTSVDYVVATKGQPGAFENYGLYVHNAGGTNELAFESGTYSGGSSNHYLLSTGANLTAGAFHHLAVTADGTNVTFFADGRKVGQVVQPAALVPNTGNFQIGSAEPGHGERFNGVIDELSLYNRALSTAEIQAIYNAGSTGQCRPASVPGWYNGDPISDLAIGLTNGQYGTLPVASVYEDFDVPAGGWTVTGAFSVNALDSAVTQAEWEIRSGMSSGNGGTLVASGTAAAALTPLGFSQGAYTMYKVEVDNLNVDLPAGRYWLSVAPLLPANSSSGTVYTTGVNAIGTPPGNDLTNFQNVPWLGGHNYILNPSSGGAARDWSFGILIRNIPASVLVSASPNSAAQGLQNVAVNLSGQNTHWSQGVSSVTFGTGITVASLTITSTTSATAIIHIDASATTGLRSISVSTGTELAKLSNAFTVTPGTPVFLTATPNSAQQGQQSLSVALVGQYTTWVQGTTTANFGAGITVASVTVTSSTAATAIVNVEPSAAPGPRTVNMLTGAKVDTLSGGFAVTAGTPVLLSASPTVAPQGLQNLTVPLTGQYTHWVQGTTTAAFGPGITLAALTVSGPASATAVLNIDPAAPTGLRSITVTTGAEIVTLNNAFTVNPPPDLTITKTHTGNFTQSGSGYTYTIQVSNAGSGPTASPVTVTDSLPTGLTAATMAGAGWTCTVNTVSCTRADLLAGGSPWSPITLTVGVAADAPATVTNTATVAGGGELNTANDTATDATTIVPLILTPTVTQLSIKSALAGAQVSMQVSGTKLGSPTTFAFQPAPASPITVQINSAAPDGSTASLTLTIPATGALGTRALIATNLSGPSEAATNPVNRFTVVDPNSNADTDGDGYPDVIEATYGTDPLDAASVPVIGSLTETESIAFSLLNAPVTGAGITETESVAFSLLNAPVTGAGITETESTAFSLLNAPVTGAGITETESVAFSLLNAPIGGAGITETESTVFSVLNAPFATSGISEVGAYFSVLNQATGVTGHAITSATPTATGQDDAPLTQALDPLLDSDGDGLPDWYDIAIGTDPLRRDTDGDGLSDFDEVFIYRTNPLDPDTDGDGFMDGIEVSLGSNPLDPNSIPHSNNRVGGPRRLIAKGEANAKRFVRQPQKRTAVPSLLLRRIVRRDVHWEHPGRSADYL